ncbi:MAG: hypothetical protein QOI03_982 [Solirubrobacteraceae bacterium]|jgi:hypothetical protein|nr:hypothetical protein [Solirubrobacteraceae bacterium]
MKRIVLTAVASSALALAAPGVASAKHGKHHHSASHHKHAKRARLEVFGGAFLAPASGSPTSVTAPTIPAAGAESAGKVLSFTGGVLTIMLKDGSTVSGKVTEQTELECRTATPSTSGGDDDQGGGDDSSTESGEHGGPATAHESENSSGDGGDGGESCTTAALVPEALVGGAELSVSGAGAVWEKVELLK